MDVPMDVVAPPQIIHLLKLFPIVGKICPFLVYQRTLFVGSPCADEGTIGLLPGISLCDVASCLQDAFQRRAVQVKAQMVVWKDFCPEDTIALESLITDHGMFPSVSYPGTRVELPPGGMPEYCKNLKGTRRHNLLKKLRRSKEQMALDVEVIQQPSGEVIDQVWNLFQQTYAQAETKFERLNRQFFAVIAQEKVAHFVLLRDQHSKQLVAFMLCFKLGKRAINKFIGLDYKLAKANHLYFRLWEAAIKWASAAGATDFQSGQTGYRAKLDIGNSLIPLTNYCRHRNALVHWIYTKVAKTMSWSTIDDDLAVYLKAHPEQRHLSVIEEQVVPSRRRRHTASALVTANKNSRETRLTAAVAGKNF